MKTKNANVLSSFVLKVIAILTMTIDHVGFMLEEYVYNPVLIEVFRSIGRLALPLFCFLLVEGVIHTKSFGKYCLRMGIIGTAVIIAQIFMEYMMEFRVYQGGIFLDLLLGAIAVKALMDKRVYIKLLALIPFAISIVGFICFSYESAGGTIYWFPYYLRPQYPLLSSVLILGFFGARWLAKIILQNQGLTYEYYQDTNIERLTINVISAGLLAVIFTLYYLLGMGLSTGVINHLYVFWNYTNFNWAILSGALILLYSGARGYNKAWFKYGQYLYYPLHLLAIYGIFYLIFAL